MYFCGLFTVGGETDNDRTEFLLSEVKGKDMTALIGSGRENLASVPSGGAAAAAAEQKKEVKVDVIGFWSFADLTNLASEAIMLHFLTVVSVWQNLTGIKGLSEAKVDLSCVVLIFSCLI